jgi:hypothetical protein
MQVIDDPISEVDYDYQKLRLDTKKYLRTSLLFISINSLLYAYYFSSIAPQLPFVEALALGLLIHFIGVTIVGLLFGILVAFIPYKLLSWRQKYRSAVVVVILLIHFILFMRKCDAILFFHTGWCLNNLF